MTVSDIARILKAEVLCEGDSMEAEVHTACGSDMMSDVLAYVKDQSVLLTGLVNSQVVRTAEMMDMVCIVFVRGKRPDEQILSLIRSISPTTSRATTSPARARRRATSRGSSKSWASPRRWCARSPSPCTRGRSIW